MERTMKRRVVTCDTVSSWAILRLLRVRVGIVGRIGGVFRASWAIARPHWALVGAYCGVLETFRGHLGPSFGHLGPFGEGGGREGGILGILEGSCGIPRRSWDGFGGRVGRHGAISGAAWVFVGRSSWPRAPYWPVGRPTGSKLQNLSKKHKGTTEFGVAGGLGGSNVLS